MNSNREEALFALALEKPAEKRTAFLDVMCDGDAALRQRLDALLAAHAQPDAALATATPGLKATMKIEFADAPDEAVGQTLGRYKLLERVGEGGCGVVYVAEQTQPVRRRVALKVIKLGMDTKQVVARFEAERQALAMMDHPNIAKVLDAGTTDVGRPYFVMELVRGIKITDYCDQANLTTKERLDLFIKVCQAIQHAHQKGIIHRDIKPSNILVTLHDGVPVPKVIDFGIAKATEGRLTDNTVYTQLHQFIGTPAYMSPEQAEMSGLDIDTRSDIYSLGVLLYELLAGSTPFDASELMASGIDAMRKTIREQEPVRPSTKLNQTLVAANVSSLKSSDRKPTNEEEVKADSRRLLRIKETITLLRGDLDWIVMKCLEKDRTRRYETANGIAADLKRHLKNEPVLARPPSAAYKFQKAFRRNKLVFAAGTVVAIALVAGFSLAALGWRQTSAERDKAVESKAQAIAAQASEAKLRQQAESAELAARQRAYASDVNLVQQALTGGNLGRAQDLLNRQRPQPGQRDLRGWEWRYLWGQCRGDELLTLTKMPAEILSLAASADGRWLASAMRGGAGMQVWDLRTRREAANLSDIGQTPRVALSPSEPLLAIASRYGEPGKFTHRLRLWNIESRQYTADLPLSEICAGLAFSEDGRKLVVVTSGQQDQITVWQMPEGKKLASHTVKDAPIVNYGTRFAATRKLNRVAYAAGPSSTIQVLDLSTGTNDAWTIWTGDATNALATASEGNDNTHSDINALAFSDDGSTLAMGTYNKAMIYLYDVVSHREIGRLPGHKAPVNALVFWPDGKTLASASTDQTIRLWDVKQMSPLAVLRGHRWEVWRLALLPDHLTLVSGGKDGSINFWDTAASKPHPDHVVLPITGFAGRLAEDGNSVLTVDRGGVVSRWAGTDFGKQRELLKLNGTPVPLETVFSRDGRLLATRLGEQGEVQIWDVEHGSMLGRIPAPDGDQCVPMSFLARGARLLVYTPRDQRVHEWDLTTWGEFRSWPGPAGYRGTILSPDERFCLLLQWSGEACHIYDLSNGGQRRTMADSRATSTGDFAPDGATFAIASGLGFISLRETATLKEITRLSGFMAAAFSTAFSPDGKRLVGTGGLAEAVKMWDLESRQELLTLPGEGSAMYYAAFSVDGSVLSSVNLQGQLHLWRAPTWAEINAAEAKENLN